MMDVWEAIRTKRAVRHFNSDPLPDAVVERILDAGRRSQSSKNSQPWQFVAVRSRDTLKQIAALNDNLWHVGGAALCVVIVTPAENERSPWHMFDAGQSASYMQLAAQEMGVASCLGTIYDQEGARALLAVPEGWQPRLLISFGYPDPNHQRQGQGKAGRHSLDEVVHWDRW